MQKQPAILGVRLPDSAQAEVIEAEMAALAQKYGLELVNTDSDAQTEIAEFKHELETITLKAEKYEASFEYIAVIFHDMSRPMGFIAAATQLLYDGHPQMKDEDTGRYINMIYQSGKQLSEFFDNFKGVLQEISSFSS